MATGNYAFFDPNGNNLNEEDFIQFYSKCYFLKNSEIAEKQMETYLKKIVVPEDVMAILEWKIGRIDHKKSKEEEKVCYRYADEMKDYKTAARSGEINARCICKYIAKNYKKLSEKNP